MERDYIYLDLPDRSIWKVPTSVVVESAAKHYATVDQTTIKQATSDVEELFEDDYELLDWARNNMDWSEVKDVAEKHCDPPSLIYEDFQTAWVYDSFVE